jgi:hypothetical protein
VLGMWEEALFAPRASLGLKVAEPRLRGFINV